MNLPLFLLEGVAILAEVFALLIVLLQVGPEEDVAMNNPLVQPDPGLFIWTIVTFLVLLTLLAKFAWRPLLAGARQPSGGDPQVARRCAAGASRSWSGCTQESAQIIRQARVEAEAIIVAEPGRRRAAPGGDAAEGAGRGRRHRQERRAADPARDRRARCSRSASEAVDLSVMIASKLLQRNLSKEDNERLIEEALKQVEGRAN